MRVNVETSTKRPQDEPENWSQDPYSYRYSCKNRIFSDVINYSKCQNFPVLTKIDGRVPTRDVIIEKGYPKRVHCSLTQPDCKQAEEYDWE